MANQWLAVPDLVCLRLVHVFKSSICSIGATYWILSLGADGQSFSSYDRLSRSQKSPHAEIAHMVNSRTYCMSLGPAHWLPMIGY